MLPASRALTTTAVGRRCASSLAKLGPETMQRLRQRVVAELTTTFASTYTEEVSLAGMLQPEAFHAYVKRATGEKFLVTPHQPIS